MTDEIDRSVLPIRRLPFAGVAGKTLGDSRPDWGLIGRVKPALADAQAGLGGTEIDRRSGEILLRRDRRRHQRAEAAHR